MYSSTNKSFTRSLFRFVKHKNPKLYYKSACWRTGMFSEDIRTWWSRSIAQDAVDVSSNLSSCGSTCILATFSYWHCATLHLLFPSLHYYTSCKDDFQSCEIVFKWCDGQFSLRSEDFNVLCVPNVSTEFGNRVFGYFAPSDRNALQKVIKLSWALHGDDTHFTKKQSF